MANYYTQLSALFPVGSAGNVAQALAIYRQFRDELEENDGWIGFVAEADEPPGGTDLWLHSDEDADIEHVIAFALRAAEALDLRGLWGFRWALTCSKPRLDGYGGGAQLLDLGERRSLSWMDTGQWLHEEAARLCKPTNAAAVTFNPVAAAQGWTGTTQADLLLGFVGQEIAADPAVAARFRAFLATVSGGPDGSDEMLCRECGKPMFIEENGVSHHEGGGLDGIEYGLDLDHVAVAEREP